MPNLMTADTGMNEDARKGDMQLWTNVNRHGGLEAVDDDGQGVVSITTKDGTRLSASAKSFMDTFPKFGMNKTANYNGYEGLSTGGDAMRTALRGSAAAAGNAAADRANADIHANTGESAAATRDLNQAGAWRNNQNRSTAVAGVSKANDFTAPNGQKYSSAPRPDMSGRMESR